MATSAQSKKRVAERGDGDPVSPGPNVIPIRAADDSDPLASFLPEGDGSPHGRVSAPATSIAAPAPIGALGLPRRTLVIAAASVVVALLLAIPAGLYFRTWLGVPAAVKPVPLVGHALLNSRPEGVAVVIDGIARGITPLEVELTTGAHDVVFRSATGERTVPIVIENGARMVENVDMPAAAAVTAQIDVTSDPTAARVLLDGRAAGQTPLKLRDVLAGRHVITVSEGPATVNRPLEIAAGATASVFVSLAATPKSTTGTFLLESPVDLRLLENGQLFGVANAAPLTIAAGKHQFELVNDSLELHLARTVTIDPGKATHVSVTMPNGSLSVNASPWADVFVDGQNVGVTPLGNVPVAVGSHELVWRHPQLGERKRTVVVGARTPVRVAVDLTR